MLISSSHSATPYYIAFFKGSNKQYVVSRTYVEVNPFYVITDNSGLFSHIYSCVIATSSIALVKEHLWILFVTFWCSFAVT